LTKKESGKLNIFDYTMLVRSTLLTKK